MLRREYHYIISELLLPAPHTELEKDLAWCPLRHTETLDEITPAHDELVFSTIERVAFIENIGAIGEPHETVGKATQHPDLPSIFFAEPDRYVFAECGASAPHIDSNIAHRARLLPSADSGVQLNRFRYG